MCVRGEPGQPCRGARGSPFAPRRVVVDGRRHPSGSADSCVCTAVLLQLFTDSNLAQQWFCTANRRSLLCALPATCPVPFEPSLIPRPTGGREGHIAATSLSQHNPEWWTLRPLAHLWAFGRRKSRKPAAAQRAPAASTRTQTTTTNRDTPLTATSTNTLLPASRCRRPTSSTTTTATTTDPPPSHTSNGHFIAA